MRKTAMPVLDARVTLAALALAVASPARARVPGPVSVRV
jgi:hypothetical protein